MEQESVKKGYLLSVNRASGMRRHFSGQDQSWRDGGEGEKQDH